MRRMWGFYGMRVLRMRLRRCRLVNLAGRHQCLELHLVKFGLKKVLPSGPFPRIPGDSCVRMLIVADWNERLAQMEFLLKEEECKRVDMEEKYQLLQHEMIQQAIEMDEKMAEMERTYMYRLLEQVPHPPPPPPPTPPDKTGLEYNEQT